MNATFESAHLGDRVWSITKGWGEIVGIDKNAGYPLQVKWDSAGIDTFTFDGHLVRTHTTRTLFWDDAIPIIAPTKPPSMGEVAPIESKRIRP